MEKLKIKYFKKWLISIIICMLLISFVIPSNVYAWDLGGVLFKPTTALTLLAIDAANVLLSITFRGVGGTLDDITFDSLWDGDQLMSPEYIFAGQCRSLNANIFTAEDTATFSQDVADGAGASIAGALKRTAAGLYEIIRNLCGVLMLCMLLYTGIRIVLAAGSPIEKREWLMKLLDWVKALILLIFMHYIMIGLFELVEIIMNAFQPENGRSISGQLRALCAESFELVPQLIGLVMYTYTTYLTIVFAIAYAKRLLWIIVLIIIAPIVAIAYCFGRTGHRIFAKWFREYALAVFIQPYHYLIYYILVTIPINLASSGGAKTLFGYNTGALDGSRLFVHIYSLIAIAMIRPFEKYIRQLFDFNGQVANQASYESGKQTLNTIKEVVKTAAQVVVAAYTGGAVGGKQLMTKLGSKAMSGAGGKGEMVSKAANASGKGGETGGTSGDSAGGQDLLAQYNSFPDTQSTEGYQGDGYSTSYNLQDEGSDAFANLATSSEANANKEDDNTDNKPALSGADASRLGVSDAPGFRDFCKAFASDGLGGVALEAGLSSDLLDAGNQLRKSLHQFTDSLAIPGMADGDWKPEIDKMDVQIKEKREQIIKNFANNQQNIDAVVNANGGALYQKHLAINKGNESKALADAQAEAKSILTNSAGAYLNTGVKDPEAVLAMVQEESATGASSKDIIAQYASASMAAKKQEVVQNMAKSKVKPVAAVGEHIIKKQEDFRSNVAIAIQQATGRATPPNPEQVERVINNYGQVAHNNPIKLADFAKLEEELKKEVRNVTPEIVKSANDQIESALRRGMTEIVSKNKPGKDSEAMTKVLEVFNKELGRRKEQQVTIKLEQAAERGASPAKMAAKKKKLEELPTKEKKKKI